MKADSWMPVYVGDYLRDTMHLTTEQHGAYLLLLFCCWFARGLLDDNDVVLASVCKVTPENWKTNLRPVLVKFFEVGDGHWISKRVAEERLKADNLCEFRQKIGSKGGSKKAANALANATAIDSALLKQNPTPSESPSPYLKKEYESDANLPTVEEVLEAAKISGVTEETAQSFFDWHKGNRKWMNDKQELIDWRYKLTKWQANGRTFEPKGKVKPTSASSDMYAKSTQIKAMESKIQRLDSETPMAHYDGYFKNQAEIKVLQKKIQEIEDQMIPA